MVVPEALVVPMPISRASTPVAPTALQAQLSSATQLDYAETSKQKNHTRKNARLHGTKLEHLKRSIKRANEVGTVLLTDT